MLGKLLKYDFKSSYLYLLVCYAIYIVMTVCFTFTIRGMISPVFQSDTAEMLYIFAMISVTLLWAFALIGVVILTYVLIIRRFYTNMVSDQGYLTLTLPVSTRMHMLSKLISGLVFELVTMLVIGGGIVIVAAGLGDEQVWRESGRMIQDLFREFNTYFGAIYYINSVLGAVRGLLLIYFSICVGQLFAKHKIWGSIGTYLGILIVLELLVTIASIVMGVYGGMSVIEWYTTNGATWVNTLFLLAQIAVYFFVGSWLLEKKANLE